MAGSDHTTLLCAGRTLNGRYRLVAPIAKGGMAEVWEAQDEVLSRPVAAKVLQPHLAADGVFLERFRREAVTAARLAHPGIVATFDTGLDHGTAFIVMELVRGRNLRQVLNDHGHLEPGPAVSIAKQIADVLAYAHQVGLVHRDIKPANVLLAEDPWIGVRVKVTDFGIAKAGAGLDGDLTRAGMVLGTPKYLSPEQIVGRDPDARADLYALGVVLFEMLVGSPPFAGDTDMATAISHLNDPVPSPASRVNGIPDGLDRLVCELLAKDPDERVQTAFAVRQRLDALVRPNGGPPAPVAVPPIRWELGSRPNAGAPNASSASENGTAAGVGRAATTRATPSTSTTASATAALAGGTGLPPPVLVAGSQPVRAPSPVLDPPATQGVPAGKPGRTRRTRRPRRRRSGRAIRFIVPSLILIGAVVAAVLVSTQGHRATAGGQGILKSNKLRIVAVTVFMVNGRPPDNPQQTAFTFDGNPNTYWSTDIYRTATFSNLYPGIGLSVELSSSSRLDALTVDSPTRGWAAQVYVSPVPVNSPQPIAAWGHPVAAKAGVSGNTAFSLAGHSGRYVLLFLTNLGPGLQARINELAVS